MNYTLRPLNKEKSLLNANRTFYTDEYMENSETLWLSDQIEEDQNGRMQKCYRLHAKAPHNIEMALVYDIKCPTCGTHLKQIGRCMDSHNLGMYICPSCRRR